MAEVLSVVCRQAERHLSAPVQSSPVQTRVGADLFGAPHPHPHPHTDTDTDTLTHTQIKDDRCHHM